MFSIRTRIITLTGLASTKASNTGEAHKRLSAVLVLPSYKTHIVYYSSILRGLVKDSS